MAQQYCQLSSDLTGSTLNVRSFGQGPAVATVRDVQPPGPRASTWSVFVNHVTHGAAEASGGSVAQDPCPPAWPRELTKCSPQSAAFFFKKTRLLPFTFLLFTHLGLGLTEGMPVSQSIWDLS